MKFQEIISRLTGVSTPIFGAQWNPPESQRAVAGRVIAFPEDRHVLLVPSEMESPEHCVHLILWIREFLTQELGRCTEDCSYLRSRLAAATERGQEWESLASRRIDST